MKYGGLGPDRESVREKVNLIILSVLHEIGDFLLLAENVYLSCHA